VPAGVDWWYVFGSATLVAFIVQIVTGVVLAMSYVPAPNSAYDSINFITHQAVLGSLIRGIHYFGASAMVILITVHLAHEFLAGSYKFPREVNWFTGTLLFFLTLGMAFTGQLLRWDQDAYWAVVVAAEQAGRTPFIGQQVAELVVAGQTVGGATLTRFYATHVFLIPALMFLLIGIHLYLVIYLGISEPPEPGVPVDPRTYEKRYHEILEDGVPFFPDAVWKDIVFALAVGLGVLILAATVGPPELKALADPTIIKADPRPDWYFLWYFALLALIPPGIENEFILGFPLLAALALLLLPFLANKGERSPLRRPWAVAIVVVSALAILALIREGDIAPWSPNLSPAPIPESVLVGKSPSARAGAYLFQRDGCIDCHMIAGAGGLKGPDLTHVGSQLTPQQMDLMIMAGQDDMPAFAGHIPPQDLTNIVDFLSSLK
jgi:ubiquinol-cytochrome c reductase cytochrome b subunit